MDECMNWGREGGQRGLARGLEMAMFAPGCGKGVGRLGGRRITATRQKQEMKMGAETTVVKKR